MKRVSVIIESAIECIDILLPESGRTYERKGNILLVCTRYESIFAAS